MSDERQHAETVAREVITCRCGVASYGDVELTVCNHADFGHVADLIERERAGLLARAEAAEAERATWRAKAEASGGHGVKCRLCSGVDHENLDLRAKLAAAQDLASQTVAQSERLVAELAAAKARVAELGCECPDCDGDGWVVTQSSGDPPERDGCPSACQGDPARVVANLRDRAEKAEAAAGQMRAALELAKRYFADLVGDPDGHLWVEYCHSTEKTIAVALATDAGRGYQGPEQVAQACAAARVEALEEAAQVCVRLLGAATYTASTIRALKVTP